MTNIVFPVIVFYTVLILLLTSAGFVVGVDTTLIEFPIFPVVPGQTNFLESVGLFGTILVIPLLIVEFVVFVLLILTFIFKLIGFTLINFLPAWLNTLLFLPLILTIVYEVIARFFGFGSAG